MTTQEMEKEVDLLFPTGKPITLNKKEVIVAPYGFGKFPKVMAVLGRLAEDVQAGSNKSDEELVKKLLQEGGEEVITLCMLAIDQDRKYFDTLPGDEGIELVQAILEVNRDFFTKRLQPKVMAIVSKLSELVGAKSLLDSSKTVTG